MLASVQVVAASNDVEMNVTGGTRVRVKNKRRDEQAIATREKLCIAALETISRIGYHASTTPLIARRAGVSRGAQTHHYPSKLNLVTAAFSYLLNCWEQKRRDYLDSNSTSVDAEAYLDFLWREIFNGRYYVATLEIMLAARGDKKLKNALTAQLREYSDVRISIWRSLLTPAMSTEESDTLMHMTICLFRGMSMQSSLDSDAESSNAKILKVWKSFMSAQIGVEHEREPDLDSKQIMDAARSAARMMPHR